MSEKSKRVYLVVDAEIWGMYVAVMSEIGTNATADLATYIQNVALGAPAAIEQGLKRRKTRNPAETAERPE